MRTGRGQLSILLVTVSVIAVACIGGSSDDEKVGQSGPVEPVNPADPVPGVGSGAAVFVDFRSFAEATTSDQCTQLVLDQLEVVPCDGVAPQFGDCSLGFVDDIPAVRCQGSELADGETLGLDIGITAAYEVDGQRAELDVSCLGDVDSQTGTCAAAFGGETIEFEATLEEVGDTIALVFAGPDEPSPELRAAVEDLLASPTLDAVVRSSAVALVDGTPVLGWLGINDQMSLDDLALLMGRYLPAE